MARALAPASAAAPPAPRAAPGLERSSVGGADPAGADRVGRRRALLLGGVLAAYAGLSAVGLWQHVMWFDELQAWNIARASHSLGGLYANLRYEGHPIAWYLVLYVLTRFTGDPRAMQALELVVMTATAGLVLLRAPFSVPGRIGAVTGYFLAFEYGVISRSYGLGALALVTVLVLVARPRPAWSAALAAAVLLAWTSVAGALVAAVLAVAVASRASGDGHPSPGRRRFVLGSLLAAIGAALTCLPPSDFHEFTPGLGNLATVGVAGPTRVLHAAGGVWRALVPLPARLGGWNTQLLDRLPGAAWVEVAASIVLVVAVAVTLRSPLARRCWLVGVAAAEAFFVVVVLPDHARYAGTVFLVFLAAVWLAQTGVGPGGAADPRPPGRGARAGRLPAIVVAVLAVQVAAMLAVYPSATVHPFSPDRALADAARAHHLSDRVVSGEDFTAVGVAGYLDHTTYSVARQAWTRFFVHDDLQARRMRALTDAGLVCAAGRLAGQRHADAGLLTDRTLHGPGLGRVALADHVALYEVGPAAAAACARPA